MSRRKSMVAREPNGRPQRARSPVEVKRLLDGAASGLKDQFDAGAAASLRQDQPNHQSRSAQGLGCVKTRTRSIAIEEVIHPRPL